MIDKNHVDARYNLGLALFMKNEDIDEAITHFKIITVLKQYRFNSTFDH
jgi:TPR repeat protein